MRQLSIFFFLFISIAARSQWVSNGDHVYSTNSGNVGMGVQSPQSKLHVKKQVSVSSATSTSNNLVNITLQTPDGFVPGGTEQRLNFMFQDWNNAEESLGAIGVERQSDSPGIYTGGRINFYNYTPARGAEQPSYGLVKTFSIDRFGNASILSTVHYEEIPSGDTILKLRFHTPNVHTPFGVENKISFVTKAFNNAEVEAGAISVKVGDAENGSYGGGEILFYTEDSSPGGGVPGQGLLERVRIDSKGRVGIGTSTPDEALTVKGNIHTREIRVDLKGAIAPDYVFSNDYDLRKLSEVEDYIHENKHLPEVPSANEMEEQGINLKEMNLLLLKKVEELTLYMIEQNKKADDLNKKLAEQQEVINAQHERITVLEGDHKK